MISSVAQPAADLFGCGATYSPAHRLEVYIGKVESVPSSATLVSQTVDTQEELQGLYNIEHDLPALKLTKVVAPS